MIHLKDIEETDIYIDFGSFSPPYIILYVLFLLLSGHHCLNKANKLNKLNQYRL